MSLKTVGYKKVIERQYILCSGLCNRRVLMGCNSSHKSKGTTLYIRGFEQSMKDSLQNLNRQIAIFSPNSVDQRTRVFISTYDMWQKGTREIYTCKNPIGRCKSLDKYAPILAYINHWLALMEGSFLTLRTHSFDTQATICNKKGLVKSLWR
jgi:hypothetical protein